MQIVFSDEVIPLKGTTPNYTVQNPIWKVAQAVENNRLAAELECYDLPSLQYLFPFHHLSLYGPQGSEADTINPFFQDNKEDFQKQNIKDFKLGNSFVVRGWTQAGNWKGPFLKFSYRAGPTTLLSSLSGHQLGRQIKLWFKIGNLSLNELLTVPYNKESDRYELEIWGYPGADLAAQLDERGQKALAEGHIISRPDLVKGSAFDFQRDDVTDQTIADRFPDHAMHPLLPLHLELAWANEAANVWDSNGGTNYHLEFGMLFRGWNNYLAAGVSANPHGGVGFLEFRNLFSNYFQHKKRPELGRTVQGWNFDAYGQKNGGVKEEKFMTVDYMDLHILRSSCGIGIHRHRDNQEVFLMMEGQGLMIVGDWMDFPERDRCFEVRTMRSGDLTLCKTGQLHALLNLTDTDAKLFMFGGYD